MPAFTFEKISPPTGRDPSPASPIEKKPRNIIIQVLGRFVEKRGERAQRVENDLVARREQREPE
jgi:hypothetical protein